MRLSKNQRRLIDLGFELLEQQKSQDNETTELPKDVASLYKEMRLALFPRPPSSPRPPRPPSRAVRSHKRATPSIKLTDMDPQLLLDWRRRLAIFVS